MLRSMTEEERREWYRKNPKEAKVQYTKKWKFLQKYYHKGAFFQEGADGGGTAAFGGDAIYGRDFLSAPTGEDVFDRAAMPAPMARARPGMWGRRGQQKHASLKDSDTSARPEDDPLRGVGVPDPRGRRGGGGGGSGPDYRGRR